MKCLAAGTCAFLLTSACGSSDVASPTAPTVVQSTSTTAPSANGPAPVAATVIAVGGPWICDDGEGDLCVEGGAVGGSDPTCFRNWDASSHCKQYDFAAPVNGTLLVTMRWAGPSRDLYDPDLFLVAPGGWWNYAADAWPEKHVSGPVTSGDIYRIVVLSYGPSPQTFSLILRMQHD